MFGVSVVQPGGESRIAPRPAQYMYDDWVTPGYELCRPDGAEFFNNSLLSCVVVQEGDDVCGHDAESVEKVSLKSVCIFNAASEVRLVGVPDSWCL